MLCWLFLSIIWCYINISQTFKPYLQNVISDRHDFEDWLHNFQDSVLSFLWLQQKYKICIDQSTHLVSEFKNKCSKKPFWKLNTDWTYGYACRPYWKVTQNPVFNHSGRSLVEAQDNFNRKEWKGRRREVKKGRSKGRGRELSLNRIKLASI